MSGRGKIGIIKLSFFSVTGIWELESGWWRYKTFRNKDTFATMMNKAKICKSCKKQATTLHQGYCEQCLAINVVKDWLKTDGVK